MCIRDSAYGLILPKAVLEMPRLGCINVHGSLLPRWRGAAPIKRSLWAGDAETGVTIMQMDVGLDTGDTVSYTHLLGWRQPGHHYAIRAGRNLPDKEFRYLRTVIVTAAVYRGFNSTLLLADG